MEEKLRVAELIAEASFKKKKRDAEYQAEALRMEEELAKARSRAKVYNNIEGIDLRIVKVTEVFLAKKLKIMKLAYQMCQKELQLRRANQDNLVIIRYIYPEVKFQPEIYPSYPAIISVILTQRK